MTWAVGAQGVQNALRCRQVESHLKVLRTAGLLDSERRGSWVYYRVIPEALQQLSQLLRADLLARSW